MLGASFDTVDENKHFADKFSFPFRLLCDVDRDLGRKYGALQEGAKADYPARIAYLIDENGRIAKTWPKVDVNNFASEVLAQV